MSNGYYAEELDIVAENRSKSDGFMLRFPPELRDRVKADADARGRSMNAEIILRVEKYEEAQNAWLKADADLAALEQRAELDSAEINRLYNERRELFDVLNNQERTLQSLRETHRTLSIMVKSIGDALLSEASLSDFVKVLAAGLSQVEIDNSSEVSERLPRQPWEDYDVGP